MLLFSGLVQRLWTQRRDGTTGVVKQVTSHELGIVVEAIAPTLSEAETLVKLAARSLFCTEVLILDAVVRSASEVGPTSV